MIQLHDDHAEVLREQGRYEQAKTLFLQDLQLVERAFGKESRLYARCSHNLARCCSDMSLVVEAEQWFEKAAEIKRKLREEDEEYSDILQDFGRLCIDRCEFNRAKPKLERALEIKRVTFKADALELARGLDLLARLYKETNEYEQALSIYDRISHILKKHGQEDKQAYADFLNDVASFYLRFGRCGLSEPLLEQALEIDRRTVAPGHPDHVSRLTTLAAVHLAMGKYKSAEALYETVLENRVNMHGGKEHAECVKALSGLANARFELAQHRDAEQLYKEALEIGRHVLGSDHEDFCACWSRLANLYLVTGRYDEAEAELQRVFEIRRCVLGGNHMDYATTLDNLANVYVKRGRYQDAEKYLKKALEIMKQGRYSEYGNSMSSLAGLYNTMGRYTEAEAMWESILKLVEESCGGQKHQQYASCLHNQACLYSSMGAYGKAEIVLTRASVIMESAVGSEHPSFASMLEAQAILYFRMGRFRETELMLNKCLDIQRKFLGESHPHFAHSLEVLVLLQELFGDFESARKNHELISNIREKALGKRHPAYARSLNHRAMWHERPAEAEPLFREALDIVKQELGLKHPTYLSYLSNLATCRFEQGFHAEALQLARQAVEAMKDGKGMALDKIHGRCVLACCLAKVSGLSDAVRELEIAFDIRNRFLDELLPVLSDSHQLALVSNRCATVVCTAISVLRSISERTASDIRCIYAMVCTEKGRLLDFHLQGTSLEEAHELRALRLRLAGSVFGDGEDDEKLLLEVQECERRVASAVPWHFRPNVWQQLQSCLLSRLAFMDCFISHGSFCAFLLFSDNTGSTQFKFFELGTCKDMYDDITSFCRMLEHGLYTISQYQKVGHRLFNRLIAPVLEAWDSPPGCHLVVAPEGELARLPLVTLPNPQINNGCVLDLDIVISYVISARDLVNHLTWVEDLTSSEYSALVKPSAAIFANASFGVARYIESTQRVPKGGGGTQARTFAGIISLRGAPQEGRAQAEPFQDLPGTKDEEEAVSRHLREKRPDILATCFTGERATVEAFIEQVRPTILHIATHGFYIPWGDDADQHGNLERRLGLQLDAHMRTGLAFAGARAWQAPSAVGDAVEALGLTSEKGKKLNGQRGRVVALEAPVVGDKVVVVGLTWEQGETLNGLTGRITSVEAGGGFVVALKNGDVTSLRVHNLRKVGGRFGIKFKSGETVLLKAENLRKDPTGLRPGIVVAMDICGMDLRGTELVVCACCNSALGDGMRGEGVLGMGRAFMHAGARTMALAVWSINDAMTCKLISGLYEVGLEGGLPNRALALREAQRRMRADGARPGHWGGLIMYGAADMCPPPS